MWWVTLLAPNVLGLSGQLCPADPCARLLGEFVDDLRSLVRVLLAVGRRDGLSEEQVAQRVRDARPGREFVARLNPEGFVTFSHKKIVRG